MKTNKDVDTLAFEGVLAQLRHAYTLLIAGYEPWEAVQRRTFANGLLAPQITMLELLVQDHQRLGDDLATTLNAYARQQRRLKEIEDTLLAKAGEIASASQARRVIFSVFHAKGKG